ncbi:MAG: hypothetical protein GXY48_03870 [Methanomicrobiales archaeon]|nr:hypothetical protein [Methanomicrobiales archaeon]
MVLISVAFVILLAVLLAIWVSLLAIDFQYNKEKSDCSNCRKWRSSPR